MKVLLDTNVLVYDTVEDSPFHEKAKEIVDTNEPYVSKLVIHEFIWVMLKLNLDPNIIGAKVKEYTELCKLAEESAKVYIKALRELKARKLSTKRINDLIILFTAKENGLALATFDGRLSKLAEALGVSVVR
ncbi:MAG: PIN domain-containing protein [Crenarchaeota archaeon]|nr:PIN domain-containing protein [Thermoproteota archaeon]